MTNLEATCTRCDRPARGDVPAADAYPAHYCRQCSAEHCEMAAYLRERPHTKVWGSAPTADDVRAAQRQLDARLAQHQAFLAAMSGGPRQDDVDALRGVLDLMANFSDNDQRARYLLSSNWLRDFTAARLAFELATLDEMSS